jgi:alpha-ketoglutarate-dependent taurine dioxygenase
MYVRNFGDGLGLSWQTAFQTEDPSVVEATCKEKRIEFEWKPGGRLRTRQIRPAFVKHPVTGESLWFNHITFFHLSTLDSVLRDVLAAEFSEEDLPNNTYYGDGTRIETEVMQELRNAYESELVSFSWQTGDVVLLDNVLTAHARASFSGPRKVLFAMAEPIVRTDF